MWGGYAIPDLLDHDPKLQNFAQDGSNIIYLIEGDKEE